MTPTSKDELNLSSKSLQGSTSTSLSNDAPAPIPGPDLLTQIIADANSLDRFLDRDPHSHPLTDGELDELVRIERAKRAHVNIKAEKRAAKKQGVEE